MRCPPIDILVGFVYIEGAGVTPRPSVCYQFSNLRIAAVIRPEIVPARIVSAKTCNLLGCAVGLCRRRFFLLISTTPFLLKSTLQKMRDGKYVTTETIERLCLLLDCTPNDLMKITK